MSMSAGALGARARAEAKCRLGKNPGRQRRPMVVAASGGSAGAGWSCVELGECSRMVFMLTPSGRGSFREQAQEVLSAMERVLLGRGVSVAIVSQTVFLRQAEDQELCKQVLRLHFGESVPATNYVLQPPCEGAALALEAWAIGGADVCVQEFGPHTLAVAYDGVRWVYCAGIEAPAEKAGVYTQATAGLDRLRSELEKAGSGLEYAVRTWIYLGDITEVEGSTQRYMELNRARTDYYQAVPFYRSLLQANIPHGVYPASTGIGMRSRELRLGCVTLQTARKDAFLVPLENPQQTPAYAYHPRYSPQSPKFSRAMALVLGGYVTTWISGTASIVNSETQHLDSIEGQTEQTIANIERLIAPENFSFHGVSGGGASLRDLAKVRVYIKRAQDFVRCKAICESRFGQVPAVYVLADVCRPELLVEIEGVAFSAYRSTLQAVEAVAEAGK